MPPRMKSLLTEQQSLPSCGEPAGVGSWHMEGTRPENPDISLSHKKERALDRTPPDSSRQLDLEVRVLAEVLLDIYEFQQKRKGGGPSRARS